MQHILSGYLNFKNSSTVLGFYTSVKLLAHDEILKQNSSLLCKDAFLGPD